MPGSAQDLLAAAQARTLVLAERGVEIALLDWGGTGPLALLHHATGFCKGTLALVADGLRERFRVVAMDARGHGDSSSPEGPDAYAWSEFAADAAAVAEQLTQHIDRGVALALGHSFGGTCLLGAAAQRPELFERLLLVDPVILRPPGRAAPSERSAPSESLVERTLRRRSEWASRAEARASFAPRPFFADWDPRALDLYTLDGLRERADGSVTLKCRREVEAAVFAAGADADPRGWAARTRARTRILWASRGNFSRAAYEALAASMPDASVESVDGGHLVPMERPAAVVEAALRFAERGAQPRASRAH